MARFARALLSRAAFVGAVAVSATCACRSERHSGAVVPASASQPAPAQHAAFGRYRSAESQPTAPPALSAQAPESEAPTPTCGPLVCTRYDTAADAFNAVLAKRPRVLAVGEAHARRGAPDVLSATERFGEELLPLAQRAGAKALIVELLQPPTGCPSDTESVRAAQKPVVEQQDAQNQDRFVELGHRARALDIVPLLLEPTCQEFARVRQAGADGVAAMLELITEHSRAKLSRLLTQTEKRASLLLAYGGALHNDIASDGEDKPFAFGADLLKQTNGRYIALDLIVPEYVAPTPAWQALPWYQYFQSMHHEGVTLIEHGPHEYTLILRPNQTRPPAPAPSTQVD